MSLAKAEEIIVEIASLIGQLRHKSRIEQLRELAKIQGMYVPRFYDIEYKPDGTVSSIAPNEPGIPERVLKRIVITLPKPFTRFIVPNVDTVHNRAPIEIMRGCTRGCRFCHAGMVTRQYGSARLLRSCLQSKKSCKTPALKRLAC